MINEHSSFNAAFGLASVLQERDHKIFFFVKAGTVFPEYVEKNGFESVIMDTKPFAYNKNKAKFRYWSRLKNHAQRMRLEQNCLSNLIKKKALDLVFLDNIYSYPFSTVLANAKVPTILLFPNFGSRLNSEYPPVFSSMIPFDKKKPTIRFRFVCSCLWIWAIITKGKAISLSILEFLQLAFRRISFRIYKIGFERTLRKFGWKSTWSEWTRRPIIPEIVMAHRSLDWHAAGSNPDRCYFGTGDYFRKGTESDWLGINTKSHIIYCSISTARGFQRIAGSGSDNSPMKLNFSQKKVNLAKRFLKVTIDAFSIRKDWQLILACGPFFRILQNSPLSPNIHLFERVPQLAVLEQVNLAITWGGAGTIRECVNFGVPMIVFPVWSDQFGNAARVSFRNLGLQGNILDITAEKMIEMVEKVFADKTIRFSVEEMKRQCNAKKEIQELVHFVKCKTALEV